jgi:hypothetical protein
MPAYDYVKEDGEIVTIQMSMKRMREREDKSGSITLEDGTKARRSWQGYQSSCPSNYPMTRLTGSLTGTAGTVTRKGSDMPKVGGKHYSYTKAGKKAAATARKSRKRKSKKRKGKK